MPEPFFSLFYFAFIHTFVGKNVWDLCCRSDSMEDCCASCADFVSPRLIHSLYEIGCILWLARSPWKRLISYSGWMSLMVQSRILPSIQGLRVIILWVVSFNLSWYFEKTALRIITRNPWMCRTRRFCTIRLICPLYEIWRLYPGRANQSLHLISYNESMSFVRLISLVLFHINSVNIKPITGYIACDERNFT